jgi:hypothetical protein
VDLPSALDAEEEVNLLGKLQGLRPGSQRVLLQKMLEGGIMRADPSAMREWEAIQEQFKPPPEFRMKVVDVNRTCKGTRTGGLYRYRYGRGQGLAGWLAGWHRVPPLLLLLLGVVWCVRVATAIRSALGADAVNCDCAAEPGGRQVLVLVLLLGTQLLLFFCRPLSTHISFLCSSGPHPPPPGCVPRLLLVTCHSSSASSSSA